MSSKINAVIDNLLTAFHGSCSCNQKETAVDIDQHEPTCRGVVILNSVMALCEIRSQNALVVEGTLVHVATMHSNREIGTYVAVTEGLNLHDFVGKALYCTKR